MEVEINRSTLTLMRGDITKQKRDAIVNAANGTLLGGGGVDGAIHRAAGPELLEECKRLRKEVLKGEMLPTGDAVITKGYLLPAQYVIHTVGPVWQGGDQKEKELLANCYKNALGLASEKGLQSISFPSISTGVYRFPIELASKTALSTIIGFLKKHPFGKVVMTLFSEEDYHTYQSSLEELIKEI
ncbi:O-acetyl-ADP-ribose deacetylase [Siminovitchia sp. FSL H7-0308]|uniref:O-acetyl-ADP-ribose deacetylase (Regulator of RNase III) n=1 Tax=Siminovitchia thermophila TaxID=1245522 RepID=A0ABS2R4I5_9BACI|nr:O-acetyl-ADP-ribose deacetylase [Siminovitchia thermophila]MBM7714565.1 O-acetyl-ADP-ribose deacetylase (regulator of RNase III) [Siminovitchia thermophila]ONK22620.1 O-acetyl-ADP-ribose deacetylase [Bacillus sp. VT-16-64]